MEYTEQRPLRLIELFAGIGSQTQALKNIGVPHKVSGTQQYRQAGNGIVVQVLEAIFNALFFA